MRLAPATGAKNSQPGKMVASPVRVLTWVRSSAGSSPPSSCRCRAAVPARVRRALIAASSFSVTGVSVSGRSRALSREELLRWVSGSNLRMDSISSPKKSMRTGRSISGE